MFLSFKAKVWSVIACLATFFIIFFIIRTPLATSDILSLFATGLAIATISYILYHYNRERYTGPLHNQNAADSGIALEEKLRELNRVNEELRALKQIEKFAATGRIARTLAHEVRNPLTNISLAAEQLTGSIPSGTENAMLVDLIARNTVRINQLVSELLQSTRFAQLNFEKAEISQLLEDTLAMARDRIDLNHVSIHKNYSPEPCYVMVDIEKMKFGLLNIIINAIEAMEKNKGVMTIATKRQDGKCRVEIKDNGIGMDEEAQQKIFEPYFTGKHRGTGLGLTNSQNIIFNHKGLINVKSTPGEGTCFIITLNSEDPDHVPKTGNNGEPGLDSQQTKNQ